MSNAYKLLIIIGSFAVTIFLTFSFISIGNTLFPREETLSIREAQIVAENWVRNFSSLYPLYGRDYNLVIKEKREIAPGEYEFSFTFKTNHPYYGIHDNHITVRTDNMEIVYAITNDVYDEIAKGYIEDEEKVNLYFVMVIEEEGEEKVEIRPVERIVSTSALNELEEVVLTELFRGPTEEELEMGYKTFIENGTSLSFLNIENRIAHIELTIHFNDQKDIAKEQIVKTLTQLHSISEVFSPERRRHVVIIVDGVPEDFVFERDLQEGMIGEDVLYLQKVLNADPETVVSSDGPGSPGEEVENFCSQTTHAVMNFQRKYYEEILIPARLILVNGIVDFHTRDKLNAILEENRL